MTEDIQTLEYTQPTDEQLAHLRDRLVLRGLTREVRHRLSQPERLKPVTTLRERVDDYSWSDSLEELELYEQNPHPYAPTIGAEIEVYRHTLVGDGEEHGTKDERLKQKWGLLKEIEDAGIPRDHSDPDWWEFAFKPANSEKTILAEAEVLDALDVVQLDEHFYPLHLTIGGISLDRNTGREVYLLARALEASGWATSPIRLMMPYTKRGEFWRSGDAGVHEREFNEIKGAGSAVEIRTLCVKGKENLEATLEAAYYLGAALSAYQDINEAIEVKSGLPFRKHITIDEWPKPKYLKDADLNEVMQLSQLWKWFGDRIYDLFIENGLKDPAHEWVEPSKGRVTKTPGDFGKLTELLEKDPKLSQTVQRLIGQVVAGAKKVMGP